MCSRSAKSLSAATAVHADQVIVVAAFVEFEHRVVRLEAVAPQDLGLDQLVEHAVHGREPGVVVLCEQDAVDVFGAQVAPLAGTEHLQDAHAGRRRLEAGALEVGRIGHHGWHGMRLRGRPRTASGKLLKWREDVRNALAVRPGRGAVLYGARNKKAAWLVDG
jgi:hypothetical protein